MPVRTIRQTAMSITGFRKPPGQPRIAFESKLESNFLALMLFDPTVAEIEEQPFAIEYLTLTGRVGVYHPDFRIKFHLPKPETICEVKQRAILKHTWKEARLRFAAGRRFAQNRGMTFRLVTESTVATPRARNARKLLPFRRPLTDDGDVRLVRDAAADPANHTLEDILRSLPSALKNRDRWLAALWHLIATFAIPIDLDADLSTRAVILRR